MKIVKATAGCIIFNEKSEVMLVKRATKPFKNKWCFPGGHIDFGETAIDAVKREIKEETGLNIKPEFFKYIDEIHKDIGWHAVVLVFKANVKSAPLNYDKNEIEEARWFKIPDAKKLDLAFDHNQIMRDVN